MSVAEHSLIEIPAESLLKLRDSFKVNWPEHILAYNLIDNLINRFKRHPEHRNFLKIFSVDGLIEDSTFIAVLSNKDVLIGTLDPQFTRLKIGIRLIDYSKKRVFMSMRDIYRNIIFEMIRERGLKTLFDDGTVMFHLSYEDALKLELNVPKGIYHKVLSQSDAEKINSLWPHKADGSENFIRYTISYNENVGLYEKSSEELVAWCLQHDFSCLLALQVDEKHVRKGYGSLVAKALSKKIAENHQQDVISNIVHENFKSKKLFEKIGFKSIDTNSWIGVIE